MSIHAPLELFTLTGIFGLEHARPFTPKLTSVNVGKYFSLMCLMQPTEGKFKRSNSLGFGGHQHIHLVVSSCIAGFLPMQIKKSMWGNHHFNGAYHPNNPHSWIHAHGESAPTDSSLICTCAFPGTNVVCYNLSFSRATVEWEQRLLASKLQVPLHISHVR